ncbi:MAG: glycosyltransferase family 8 protein [Candidatus Amulumruptor caecigallinarius]|nr:glycosyltransferase family 8 protein [Candidatus Amulumruptor caecigallinarius]MCM1396291.1 glycosyltransferase family 8 protein [Candidatus Amulumruptor caecigallinarius]MCM1454285.1 glycosyltransferase family 8 protein [bacterium]
MLTSLLESNRQNQIAVYLLTDGLSGATQNRFRLLSDTYGCEISLITPSQNVFRHCIVRDGDHVTTAAYYRVACAELLPNYVERVIYLDCDIIVNTDLRELWDTPLDGAFCGVVTDSFYVEGSERLGISTSYFNSGMMLIDVEAFRRQDVARKCFKLMREEPERIKFHDQDLLNIVVGDKVKRLPLRWNMLTAFLRTDHAEQYIAPEMEAEIAAEAAHPERLIIHYEYLPKPWQPWVMIRHPFYNLWHEVRHRSLWADAPIDRKVPLSLKLRILTLNALWSIGLKKRPQYYIV